MVSHVIESAIFSFEMAKEIWKLQPLNTCWKFFSKLPIRIKPWKHAFWDRNLALIGSIPCLIQDFTKKLVTSEKILEEK